MSTSNTIERAMQLAHGGTCRSVDDIRRKLKQEQFDQVDNHLNSASFKRQLIMVMKPVA